MASLERSFRSAQPVASDDLAGVLACLGPDGDARSRLAAVVALLTGGRAESAPSGGAFAQSPPFVTAAFTSGFHNCLRGPAVNRVQHDASAA